MQLEPWCFFKWAGAIACALVLVGCACRVDMMRVGQHKRGWLWLYTLAAPFALGVLLDLVTDRDLDWYVCFGVAAILLHLVLTRHHWRHGPPAETILRRGP